ncbi:hypothetical protein V8C34DRAFT_39938 [Trichoderma compactum]
MRWTSVSRKNVLHQNRQSSSGSWTVWMNETYCSTLIPDEFNCEDVNPYFVMGCIEVSVANLHMKSVVIDVSGIIPNLVCRDPLYSVIPLPILLPFVIWSCLTPTSSCQIKRDATFSQMRSPEILLRHHHHGRDCGSCPQSWLCFCPCYFFCSGLFTSPGHYKTEDMAEEMDDLHATTAQCMTCASLAGPGFAQASHSLLLHVTCSCSGTAGTARPFVAFLFFSCQCITVRNKVNRARGYYYCLGYIVLDRPDFHLPTHAIVTGRTLPKMTDRSVLNFRHILGRIRMAKGL